MSSESRGVLDSECSNSDSSRLNSGTEYIDLEFVERKRPPTEVIEIGFRFRGTDISYLYTK